MSDSPRSLRRAWRHLAVALLACTALGAQAQKVSMETTAANSVVGLMPQSMAPLWAKAGVDVELAMGQTLTKSQLKIGQGTLDTSVIPLPAYVSLVAGKGPYAQMGDKSKALADNVRSLWAFSASTWHVITWADGKVQNWSDLKGKRVYIGPPAGAANAQIRGLIKAASGLEEGKDYEGIKAPWGVATAGFQDGQYDVYVGAFSLGSQALVELSLSRKIRLLGLPNNVTPPPELGMQVNTIPAGTYPGMVNTEPVTTWQTLMMMAARKDLSDDLAYKLTKTYFDSLPTLKAGNAALAVLSADDALSGLVAPLHPGALKYYQETGRAVPAALVAR